MSEYDVSKCEMFPASWGLERYHWGQDLGFICNAFITFTWEYTLDKTRSSKDECSAGDKTIILQIFLDHISYRIIDQKLWWPIATPLAPLCPTFLSFLLSVFRSLFLSFCLPSVFLSLYLCVFRSLSLFIFVHLSSFKIVQILLKSFDLLLIDGANWLRDAPISKKCSFF